MLEPTGKVLEILQTYIYGKFPPQPRKLPRIRLYFHYPTGMWLPDICGISSQSIDDFQVLLEHIWVLIIFTRDVLFYGV